MQNRIGFACNFWPPKLYGYQVAKMCWDISGRKKIYGERKGEGFATRSEFPRKW